MNIIIDVFCLPWDFLVSNESVPSNVYAVFLLRSSIWARNIFDSPRRKDLHLYLLDRGHVLSVQLICLNRNTQNLLTPYQVVSFQLCTVMRCVVKRNSVLLGSTCRTQSCDNTGLTRHGQILRQCTHYYTAQRHLAKSRVEMNSGIVQGDKKNVTVFLKKKKTFYLWKYISVCVVNLVP